MPVINGVYLKDFPALPSSVADANIIPIAIAGNQIAYKTTVAGIVTDARVTSKLLTGLSVTGSTILATDTILQAFGKVQNQLNGKVSSVGLTMPSAFNVANSPITSAGTLAVTAAGVASQYIRGDGALADFPTTGGGGSSVSYYLNGSVSQGTIGGNAYYEMNKTPVIGTGTDFTIAADGYIAQFITDANDPGSLLIPGGNWNVEMYFSASSSGGTPSFYVEVYKYDGSTFTLLGSSSATPEGITNGTAIDIYYTSVGIPETVLTITDRLAIRVYVTHSGRTITLHTEDNHLSEIVTTFSNGLTALNGLTKQTQYFATGTTGTDFNISSSVDTHTFNIPSASASARGLITTGTQTIAGDKTFTGNINASPTSGNAIQAITTSSVAIQVFSTTGDGVQANSTTGAAISGNASGTLGQGVVGQAAGTGGAGGYFSGSGSAAYGVFAAASGTSTTAIVGTSNSASYPVQSLIQFGSGTIASFSNTSSIVASITNAGGLVLSSLLSGTTAAFTNSGSGIGIDVTNSGSGDGIKITHSLGRAFRIESSSTGFGIIINNLTASTSVPFTIQKQGSTVITMSDTGAANFTGQLTLGSTITNGTYTYTLPSATGTLALTSALSSYLPLTGGTLTGDLTIDLTSPNLYLKRANTSSNAAVRYNTGATLDWYVGTGVSGTNSDYHIYSGTTNADALTILKSTGAATFSSTLATSAGAAINSGNGALAIPASSTRGIINIAGSTDQFLTFSSQSYIYNSSSLFRLLSSSDIDFVAGGSQRLLISASTGAATFSGRVNGAGGDNNGILIASNGSPLGLPTTGLSFLTGYNTSYITSYNTTSALAGIYFNAAFLNLSNLGTGTVYSNAGSLTNTNPSDERLKENIKDLSWGLNEILQIKPVSYNWIDDKANQGKQYGFVAQDVQKVLPELVKEFIIPANKELETEELVRLGLDKEAIFVGLVKAIQELKAEIDLLKGEPIIPTDNNLE